MELREQGRRAFDRGEWRGSYEHLSAAVADDAPLEPADLERLAVAAYLTGHDGESTHAWTRAYRGWLDRGACEDAVRCAFWAGFGLVQRGELAQGGGWLARARTLVEQQGLDCVERGYLLLPDALMTMGSGDLEGALDRFSQAAQLAQRFADRDLAAPAALAEHVGPQASCFVHAVFSVHEPAEADELFSAAGFDEVEVETGTLGLRVDLPADFFWQYVRSTPLAAVVAGLADSARAALERDVVERCQPFVDGDAMVMEPGVLVVSGRRTG